MNIEGIAYNQSDIILRNTENVGNVLTMMEVVLDIPFQRKTVCLK